MTQDWDCVVVGGGAAGLSAALVLGRARQRTLLVDAGRPSNSVAEGIGGFLGNNGRPPADFYAAGRAEVLAHPTVELRTGEVVDGRQVDGGFALVVDDTQHELSRRVLLAPGMEYRPPDVSGIAERFGRSVFHCPFCHGWEVRDRPLGVLDRGATGVTRALLLRQWTDDVTLLTNGPAELTDVQRLQLKAADVAIDERAVVQLIGPGSELHAVGLAGGAERPCGGLLVPVTLVQRSGLAQRLGAAVAEPGPVVHDAIVIDAMFHTTVPGVFAAGDVATQMPSVAAAVAAGSTAAAMLVHDLALGGATP